MNDDIVRRIEEQEDAADQRCKECGSLMSAKFIEERGKEYLEVKCSNDECKYSKSPFIRKVPL